MGHKQEVDPASLGTASAVGGRFASAVGAAVLVALSLTAASPAFLATTTLPHKSTGLPHKTTGGDATSSKPARVAGKFLAADEWNDRIRSEEFWRPGRTLRGEAKESQGRDTAKAAQERSEPRVESIARTGTYRTVCVRLCDGYFFPINFGTVAGDLDNDAAQCERSCSSPARLYIHKVPGEDVGEFSDMSGKPYTKLKTAHLFKTQYVSSCTCKPKPWDESSIARHRIYALEAERKRGNLTVVAELNGLKSSARHTALVERAKAGNRLAAAQLERAAKASGDSNSEGYKKSRVAAMGVTVATSSTATAPTAATGEATISAEAAGSPAEVATPVTSSEQAKSRGASARRTRTRSAPGVREASARPAALEPARTAAQSMPVFAPAAAESVVIRRASNDWVSRAFNQN